MKNQIEFVHTCSDNIILMSSHYVGELQLEVGNMSVQGLKAMDASKGLGSGA